MYELEFVHISTNDCSHTIKIPCGKYLNKIEENSLLADCMKDCNTDEQNPIPIGIIETKEDLTLLGDYFYSCDNYDTNDKIIKMFIISDYLNMPKMTRYIIERLLAINIKPCKENRENFVTLVNMLNKYKHLNTFCTLRIAMDDLNKYISKCSYKSQYRCYPYTPCSNYRDPIKNEKYTYHIFYDEP